MTLLTSQNAAIVTDSTSDPLVFLKSLPGVVVVPLTVLFGDEIYEDGVDLTLTQFYEKLAAAPELPTSSQPTQAEFERCYADLCERYEHVFSIHISEEMSGTVRAARMAADRHPQVEVYDSRTVSAGCGIIVQRLWAKLQEGISLEDARAFVSYCQEHAHFVIHSATLEYLRKGGRIGRAQSLVGGVLGIHPVLHTADGYVSPYGKARGERKAVDLMMQFVREFAPPDRPLFVAIVHGANPEAIPMLTQRILEERPQAQIVMSGEIGTVVGVHIGPGPSAFALLAE